MQVPGFASCSLNAHLHLQGQSWLAVRVHVAGGQGEACCPFTYPIRAQSLVAVTLGAEFRSLGKARHGVSSCILTDGYCTWKRQLSLWQEAIALPFHMAQQHVKDTVWHCKGWWWGWELQVRQRKGVVSYLTWFQFGNRIISFIPLHNLPKWDCLVRDTCSIAWLPSVQILNKKMS